MLAEVLLSKQVYHWLNTHQASSQRSSSLFVDFSKCRQDDASSHPVCIKGGLERHFITWNITVNKCAVSQMFCRGDEVSQAFEGIPANSMHKSGSKTFSSLQTPEDLGPAQTIAYSGPAQPI